MSSKTIKFTDVEIRHYNITLGNRLVERDLGPALTLDWTFSTSKATPVDVYETEHASTSSTKRQGEALRLDVDKRVSLLVNGFGISSEKLERAMKSGQQRSNRKLVQRPQVDPTRSFSPFDIAAVEKSLKMGSIRNTSITSTKNQYDKMDLVTPKNSSSKFLSKQKMNRGQYQRPLFSLRSVSKKNLIRQ